MLQSLQFMFNDYCISNNRMNLSLHFQYLMRLLNGNRIKDLDDIQLSEVDLDFKK